MSLFGENANIVKKSSTAVMDGQESGGRSGSEHGEASVYARVSSSECGTKFREFENVENYKMLCHINN
jgi:hypothetical protein